MSDVETRETETQDRPRLRVMPNEDSEVGPFFPSGINTQEAAIAGAPGPNPLDQGEGAGELGAGESDAEAYDPSTETIDGVLNYVDQNPDQRESVLEAERAGKNRTTLINQLESR